MAWLVKKKIVYLKLSFIFFIPDVKHLPPVKPALDFKGDCQTHWPDWHGKGGEGRARGRGRPGELGALVGASSASVAINHLSSSCFGSLGFPKADKHPGFCPTISALQENNNPLSWWRYFFWHNAFSFQFWWVDFFCEWKKGKFMIWLIWIFICQR